MKKLINGVDNVVDEMLRGMVAAHPEYVERVEGTDVVVRTGAKKTDKVVLISGGGSGHEPAHGGYVGKGMLDGAVAGAVFTSPTPDQVYEAIKATECGKGALLIIKNYTGDVMNFEMAADMASDEDIEVEKVVVADDGIRLCELSVQDILSHLYGSILPVIAVAVIRPVVGQSGSVHRFKIACKTLHGIRKVRRSGQTVDLPAAVFPDQMFCQLLKRAAVICGGILKGRVLLACVDRHDRPP